MTNLFQMLNQFVMFFRKNVIEKKFHQLASSFTGFQYFRYTRSIVIVQ
jgi:hypothetical protein